MGWLTLSGPALHLLTCLIRTCAHPNPFSLRPRASLAHCDLCVCRSITDAWRGRPLTFPKTCPRFVCVR